MFTLLTKIFLQQLIYSRKKIFYEFMVTGKFEKEDKYFKFLFPQTYTASVHLGCYEKTPQTE